MEHRGISLGYTRPEGIRNHVRPEAERADPALRRWTRPSGAWSNIPAARCWCWPDPGPARPHTLVEAVVRKVDAGRAGRAAPGPGPDPHLQPQGGPRAARPDRRPARRIPASRRWRPRSTRSATPWCGAIRTPSCSPSRSACCPAPNRTCSSATWSPARSGRGHRRRPDRRAAAVAHRPARRAGHPRLRRGDPHRARPRPRAGPGPGRPGPGRARPPSAATGTPPRRSSRSTWTSSTSRACSTTASSCTAPCCWPSGPRSLPELRHDFRAVFVDEYQDTDPAQVRLLRAIAGDGADLVVFGDPDQSIYQFRGADVRGILDFPQALPPDRRRARRHRRAAHLAALRPGAAARLARPHAAHADPAAAGREGARAPRPRRPRPGRSTAPRSRASWRS